VDKFIDYINKTNVDDIVAAILRKGHDPVSVAIQSVESMTRYQIKVQELKNRLREYFPELKVGDKLIAKEDNPTLKIKKDQEVVVSIISGVMYTLNDDGFDNPIAQASEMIVRSKFRIKESR
jgi:hypothetical protein